MAKELAINHLRQISNHNCYVSSICTAVENLRSNQVLNPDRIHKALPFTNEFYFDKVIRLLKENDMTHLNHDILLLPDTKKVFVNVAISALDGGALCSLTTWSKSWVNEIRGNKVKIKSDDNHAITIYGYYQPDSKKESNVWLYIFDPYDDQQIFIKADQVYEHLVFYQDELGREKNGTYVTLFGLSQDPTNLLSRYQPKVDHVEECDKKEIFRRLPGNSHKEKLSKIVSPRRGTLHPQTSRNESPNRLPFDMLHQPS